MTKGARIACFMFMQSMVRDPGQRRLLFDMDMALLGLRETHGDTEPVVRLTGCYHNLLRRWGRQLMFMAPPLDGIPRDIAAVADYAAYDRRRLDDNAWAYLDGAAGDELTRTWNRAAFDRQALLPRVMAEVVGGHCRTTLFGREYPCPVLLAPVAWQKLFHPDGELATAYTAAALGVGMVLSTLASSSLEEVAAAAQQGGEGPRWFQLYLQPERALNEDLIRRAEAAGYEAIVFTVDAPLNGIRNREQRAGFQLPPGIEAVNLRRPQESGRSSGPRPA